MNRGSAEVIYCVISQISFILIFLVMFRLKFFFKRVHSMTRFFQMDVKSVIYVHSCV